MTHIHIPFTHIHLDHVQGQGRTTRYRYRVFRRCSDRSISSAVWPWRLVCRVVDVDLSFHVVILSFHVVILCFHIVIL